MLTEKIKAQLLIVATFLLGILVGAAGYYLLVERGTGGLATTPEGLLEDMTRSLRLSEQQQTEVEDLLKESRQEYQDLRNQNRPQFIALRDKLRQRIKGVLTPEQQRLYDDWNRDQDAKREQQRSREDAGRR